jgi:hypothetical protein
VKLPDVFVHVAFALQLFVPFVHSLTSAQMSDVPDPDCGANPDRHWHVKLPGWFTHWTCPVATWQPPLFVAHSLTSLQPPPPGAPVPV